MAEIYRSEFSGQEIDERLDLIPEIQEGVEAAQQAADGKYTKPASGIPMTDLSDEVQEAIEEGGGQADWEQTDTTAPDYIKNKPSIPTHVVRFVQQFLSPSEQTQARANIGAGTYSKPASGIPAEDIADDVIPDVSDFITNTVNDLVNYYRKSETYSRSEVQQLIAAIQGVSFVSVASLPTPSADTMGGKIYLVPSANPDEQNVKDEFITIQDGSTYAWEQIGSTAIDLSGYVTTQQLNTALAAYTTTEALTSLLAAKQDTISDLSAIRSGAAAGATAYQKPQTGIPASDLAAGVIPSVPTDVVKYSSQSLTDAQKEQARTNIGAAAAAALTALETAIAAKYSKPSSGIPETDMATNVQSALALARTSIQSLADYYDKTQIDSLLAAVSSEQYVDVATLPTASADTLGKIYLVGPTDGVYNRYYTSYDGTTYSWVGVGTTEINLANYATKAEFNQLSQKIYGKTFEVVTGKYIKPDGTIGNSSVGFYSKPIPVKAGETLTYSIEGWGCAVLSTYSDGVYTPLVTAPSSGPQQYTDQTYTPVADVFVVFSGTPNTLILSSSISADGRAVEDLRDEVIESAEKSVVDNVENIQGVVKKAGYNAAPASASSVLFTALAGYDSYYFYPTKELLAAWIVDPGVTYVSICIVQNAAAISGNYINGTSAVRYRKSEGNLPTSGSPLSIPAGAAVIITVTAGNSVGFGYSAIADTLNPALPLAQKHIDQVLAEVSSDSCMVNISGDVANVFVPSHSGFIKYVFQRSTNASINADVWRVQSAVSCNKEGVAIKNITTSGEWEAAIHLKDRDDFSGGIAHGDEIFSAIYFFADGQPLDISSEVSMTFRELRVIEVSTLYDPADHTTAIAKHSSEHIFSAEGLVINQAIEWLVSAELVQSYMAMFPVAQAVTNRYCTDKDYTPVVIPAGGANQVNIYGAQYLNIWSADAGVFCIFGVNKNADREEDALHLLIHNNGGTEYNKCYFYIAGDGDTAAPGDIWKTQTIYKIMA